MVSCLRTPGAVSRSWDTFMAKLLPSELARRTRRTEHAALAWCISQAAAERCLLELRERGTLLLDIQGLLDLFAGMCHAAYGKADELAVLVSQFRAKAHAILRAETGPFDGCEHCAAACLYGPLGRRLAQHVRLRTGLSAAFKAQDKDNAVLHYCEKTASDNLFTSNADAIRCLAACFYVHVAHEVGARDVSNTVARLFRQQSAGGSP